MIGTDTLGRFAVTGLTPGRYTIRARQIGYEERTDTVVVTAGAGAHLHLVLTPQYFDRCMEMRSVQTRLPWWHIW
jgi:protocatechuate 3,4-dioxygenase beta subunit